MKKYDIIFYTMAPSGFGYLMRFHALCQKCNYFNLKPLFIFGAKYIPEEITNSSYDKIILPKITYNHSTSQFNNLDLVNLYSEIVRLVVKEHRPKYFVQSHISSLLQNFDYANQEIWGDTQKIALLRDIMSSPVKFNEIKYGEENFIPNLDLYFDSILIAGVKSLYDMSFQYNLPETIQNKVTYIGYIMNSYLIKYEKKYDVVISFGSGQNREKQILFIRDVLLPILVKNNMSICLINGKYNSDSLKTLQAYSKNVTLLEFTERDSYLSLIHHCKICILSGGYNSIIEALSLRKKIIVLKSELFPEINVRCQALVDYFVSIDIEETNLNLLESTLTKLINDHSINILGQENFDGVENFFQNLK